MLAIQARFLSSQCPVRFTLFGGPQNVLRHKKVLIACPFRSIVGEKTAELQRILHTPALPFPVRVASYIGGTPDDGSMDLKGVDVAIATFEKASGIVNTLYRCGDIGSLGLAVLDEIHMVGEPNRYCRHRSRSVRAGIISFLALQRCRP